MYLGGKSKIAKRLTAAILAHTPKRFRLVEPFMGGGSMTAALAPHFTVVEASDIQPDLILMWQALAKGWIPPDTITEQQYKELRNSPPSALRGFAGFGSSWAGKFFGGYARARKPVRNFTDESARSLQRYVEEMPNCVFCLCDYSRLAVDPFSVVYADPPYSDTEGYTHSFDGQKFWDTARAWARTGASVLVSEYKAPADWREIWSLTRTRDLKSKRTNAVQVTEKLFVWSGAK